VEQSIDDGLWRESVMTRADKVAGEVRWLRVRARVVELRRAALAGEFILTGRTPAAEILPKSDTPTRAKPVMVLPSDHARLRLLMRGMIVRRQTRN
jgi:hypothetical protein